MASDLPIVDSFRMHERQHQDENQRQVVRRKDAERSTPVERPEARSFLAQPDQNAGDQKSRYGEEQINARPTEIQWSPKTNCRRHEMHSQDSENGDCPKSI